MQIIICPICRGPIQFFSSSCVCSKGHEFQVIDGIVDLLQDVNSNVLDEQEHWDSVADKGRMKIAPNEFISEKIVGDYRKAFNECIKLQHYIIYHNLLSTS